MKKFARLAALMLVVVMCFSVTAMATESTDVENSKMTITSINGNATVTFDSTNEEIVKVTYASEAVQDNQFYLVMVITADANGNYTPTKDSILYINQTSGADGQVSFEVYPSAIKDSAILIYGTGIDGEANSLIAAIIDAKYLIGDANDDGVITASDASLVLQYVVSIAKKDDLNLDAANVNGDNVVTASDASKILRVVVRLDTF